MNYKPHLHGIDQHPGQPEWNFLWKLLPGHRYFKTITKINVDDLPAESIQHQVGRVSVKINQSSLLNIRKKRKITREILRQFLYIIITEKFW